METILSCGKFPLLDGRRRSSTAFNANVICTLC
jgi:hypothetical protein